MSASIAVPRTTIADRLLPARLDARTRSAVLVVGFALLTAAAAQVAIPLGFTPVPLSGQTFAVLLAGAALGANRGAASQILYLALGATGLPFYSDQTGGLEVLTGSTMGYFIGFVVAAWVVGKLAERGQDRHVATATPAFLAGSVIIYAFGAGWLMILLDVPVVAGAGQDSALTLGVLPFLVGDVLKAALAGALLPAAWKLVDRD